jgi:tRNA1Val (adenine37-N6)-methyltransferase
MDISKSYDYIISNPPFYENQLQSPDTNRNTAHHSRQLTLQRLISFIAAHLKPEGQFFFLLPFQRREEAGNMLQKSNLYIYNEVAVQQTPSHTPFRIMLQGGYEKADAGLSQLTISNGSNQYTPEFTALLQEYYLYL